MGLPTILIFKSVNKFFSSEKFFIIRALLLLVLLKKIQFAEWHFFLSKEGLYEEIETAVLIFIGI